VNDPRDLPGLVEAIDAWRTEPRRRVADAGLDVSLARNLAETLAVLEIAAREKRA
jgi:hypothetical protein